MGLIIKSTEAKKILIDGTEIEVPQVYGRVQFGAMQDGVTMEAQCTIYGSHAAFLESKFLFTTIGMPVINITLGNGEVQGTEMALNYMKAYLENMGLEVIID